MTVDLDYIPHSRHTDKEILCDISDECEDWREEEGGSMLDYYIEKHNRWSAMRSIVFEHREVLAPWYLNDFELMTREIALCKEYIEEHGVDIRPPFNNIDPSRKASHIVIDTPDIDIHELFGEHLGDACERVMNVALDEVSARVVRNGEGWGELDDYGHLNAAVSLLEIAACADKEALLQSFPNKAQVVDPPVTKRPKRRKK